VYWIPDGLRRLFEFLQRLSDVAKLCQGLATADNFRFIRYWWEAGTQQVAFGHQDRHRARDTGEKWFPHMKGGAYCKWYGNQEHVVNWQDDGKEIQNFCSPGGRLASRPQNTDYYFQEGATFTDLTSGGLSMRWMPPGFVFDHAGNCLFPERGDLWAWLASLNSKPFGHLMHINPTIHFYIGDFNRMPIPLSALTSVTLVSRAQHCTRWQVWRSTLNETTFDFIAPPRWDAGLNDLAAAQARLAALEAQIDDQVYRLYGISDEDRAAIEAELAGEPLTGEDDEDAAPAGDEEGDTEPEPAMTRQELAVRWISYAVGVVLGRFQPGETPANGDSTPSQPPPARGRSLLPHQQERSQSLPPAGGDGRGGLGRAVYRCEDFAVGSLPAPDEAEFDQLVGPTERFAYVDEGGGRHTFPAEVETALQKLAVPDGITVLDEGHECDLPALVERALQLMLDWNADTEHAIRNTRDVIEAGAGGDLRRFLERDFFTKWHVTNAWYRKRPVYWPLQSAKRSYGFVLFHERIDKSTLYILQRDYLDHKLNGLQLQIGDLRGQAETLSGAARKRVERQIDGAAQLLEEVTAFTQTMEQIVRDGYEPEPNWMDDGVILRMAPLWELIPIWWREPKKYWERLQRGDYDWSHIAMHYWPERVKEACKTNKSFTIAHGHEEWYEGD
jgi:hypothetical protein